MGITLNPGTLLNGNGIDVTSLVTASLAPQNAKLTALQQQQTTLQTESGLMTSMNGDLNNLSSAISALTDVLGPLTAMSPQSSQSTILTGSAEPGAKAGTHTIVVSALASQGTLYTDPVKDASTSILPNGVQSADLKFQVGGKNGPTHDIAIAAGTNDTLNSLVSYVNKQDWGVTATVLTDATGSRLAIYSNASGSEGALAITNNTSGLTFNPPAGGTDATFTVDGIPFSSTTNTVTGAIPGVTLNLVGAYPGVQVQLAVGPDASQAIQAISTFVGAYNTVIGDLNTQFTYNSNTNSEGPLAGDSSLRSLQTSLLTDGTYAPPQSTVYSESVQDAKTSLLPNGIQNADLQIQVGTGPAHDIAVSAGSNDTLTSLVSYINQQNWGLTASVLNDGSGERLVLCSNDPSNSGAVSIASNTTNLTFNPAVESSYISLRSLGITMNDDGTLSINSAALSSAVSSDPASLLNFFQNNAQTGFGNNFVKDLRNLTDPTQGILNMDLAQNQTDQKNISNSITDLQDQISTLQQQLQTEYSQVNAILESFPYELRAIQSLLGLTPTDTSSGATSAG